MKISIVHGNILNYKGSSIVNPVNSDLSAGYGLDGQIRKRAGITLEQKLSQIGKCSPGKAVITSGGNLPYQYIIHAVGPIWRNGNFDEEQILREVYINSLILAEKFGIKKIAFPNISTGIFRFPKVEAAEIALDVVTAFKFKIIEEIAFYCFDQENYKIYNNKIQNTVSE